MSNYFGHKLRIYTIYTEWFMRKDLFHALKISRSDELLQDVKICECMVLLKSFGTPQLWCFILICPIRPYQHWKATIFGGLTPWFIPMLRHFPMKIATHRWPWLPLPLPNRPVPDAQPRWTTPVNAARIWSRKNSLETWCLYLPDYVLTIHIPHTCTYIYIILTWVSMINQ